MTRVQKEKLAAAVLGQVGNLFEFWQEEGSHYDLEDLDQEEAAQVVAQWLKNLPGTSWSMFLPQPK